MVLLNAAKAARNIAKTVNLPNCGGTSKKAGLAPTIGVYMSSPTYRLRVKTTQLNDKCDHKGNRHPTQMVGYRATLGGTTMG